MIQSLVKCSFCAIGMLLFACGDSTSVHSTDSIRDSVVADSLLKKDKLSAIEVRYSRDSFLLDSFRVLIDSFITAYAGHEFKAPYRMDSLASRDTTYQSRRYTYLPVGGSYAKWHYFGEKDLVFELAECCYSDSASCDVGWNEFGRLAGPDFRSSNGIKDDYLPCLSYGTDYAFRTGNKIFWLCTYCNWDYDKHLIIASLLKRTVVQCKPIDEIKCRCGDVKPRSN